MKHVTLNLLRRVFRSGRPAITAALVLGSMSLTPLFANPEWVYNGHATYYPNIPISLTITEVGAAYDVTGTIRDGNCTVVVHGTVTGKVFTGSTVFSTPYSTATTAMVDGMLSGALGTGTLDIGTGAIYICNQWLTLPGMLYYQAPPKPAPAPAPVTLPASAHMTGATGFGYTVVELALDTTLKGSSYDLTGTVLVRRLINNNYVETILNVSSVLTPGVQGSLNVSALTGDAPSFSGTISANGTAFTGFLSGMPTLGITGLYINAVN